MRQTLRGRSLSCFFRPVLVEDGKDALFTGYFEPELDGSKTRTDRFKYPIYKMPPEARAEGPMAEPS